MHGIHSQETGSLGTGKPAAAAGVAGLAVQARLTIGEVDDPLEAEADAIAERVMRMPEVPSIQRKCAQCDEEDREGLVQRKAVATSIAPFGAMKQSAGATAAMASSAVADGGSSLPAPTKTFMESRFGVDFSDVRIHADDQAAGTAQQLNANAFTIGSDIYFNAGRYSPESREGRQLLAHELTHVVQQGTTRRPYIQRQISGCGDLVALPSITTLVSGRVVHQAIEEHFLASVGGATRVAIPGASAGPLRSQGLCGEDVPVIPPQQLGGAAGAGIPDLARITPGGILQVAEVKPAAVPCLIDGEEQMLRYIDQGNARDPAQIAWRAGLGVSVVSPMLPSTYSPPSLVLPGAVITTAWCTAGLLAYSVEPLPPPVRVPETESKRERRTTREPQGVPVLTPATVPVTRSAWREIGEWAKKVYEEGEDATEAAEVFLRAHPELAGVIIGAGIVAIVALIADDATIALIADDVLVPIIAALEWVAIRMAFAG